MVIQEEGREQKTLQLRVGNKKTVNNEDKCSNTEAGLEHLKSKRLQRQFNTDKCRIMRFMSPYHIL